MTNETIISLIISTVIGIIVSVLTFWLRRFINQSDLANGTIMTKLQNLEISAQMQIQKNQVFESNYQNIERTIDREIEERDKRFDKQADQISALQQKVAVIESKSKS
jgi:uncharacterized protein HemX